MNGSHPVPNPLVYTFLSFNLKDVVYFEKIRISGKLFKFSPVPDLHLWLQDDLVLPVGVLLSPGRLLILEWC